MCNDHAEASTSTTATDRPVIESTITTVKGAPKFRFFPRRTCCHRPVMRFGPDGRPAFLHTTTDTDEPKPRESPKRKVPDDKEESKIVRETLVVHQGTVKWSFTLETCGDADEEPSKRQKVVIEDEESESEDDEPIEWIPRGPPPGINL